MKLNKEARELLDRYLLGVKRELTGKQREDIAAEIESYLLDLLEERFSKSKEIAKSQMKEILQEMGAPRKIAAQYSTQRYLVGPRLFPAYLLILKIVLAAVIGALSLSFIINSVIGNTSNIWLAVLEYLGTIWNGALSAGGSITLIFALIERFGESKEIKEIDELQELIISDLPELPSEEKDPGKIGLSIEIALGIIGIAFFTYINSTGGRVPYFFNPQTDMKLVQLFTDNFLQYVPLILALAGLDLTRDGMLLAQEYHSSLTNWWHICTQSAHVMLMGFMINSLPLISLNGFQSIGGVDLDFAHLETLANTGIAIGMAVGIIGTTIEIIHKVIREIRSPSA